MISRTTILLILAVVTLHQSIPQLQPVNTTTYAYTPYKLSFFTFSAMANTSYFELNFTRTIISVPNSSLNCTGDLTVNGVLQSLTPTCSCLSMICLLRVNTQIRPGTKITITFGNLRNPSFTFQQNPSARIFYTNSTTPALTYNSLTIDDKQYTPMRIIKNSFVQSQYGVGTTNVTYTWNMSLFYIPQNPSLQISIPSEINLNSFIMTYEFNFYNTVQNSAPKYIASTLVFNIVYNKTQNPSGFFILKISGFANPQFIGNSDSFKFTILETQYIDNCGYCISSEISNTLNASSTQAGNIIIYSIMSNNYSVGAQATLTIYMKLFARIPFGGKVSIRLPTSLNASFPITCLTFDGFQTSNNQNPKCSYNSTKHSIDTDNFAYPFLVNQGSANILVSIINAPDSRKNELFFETLDDSGRLIGKSKQNYTYECTPLILNATAKKNTTFIDQPILLTINMTLARPLSPTNGDKIRVTIPYTNNYQQSLTKCFSSGLNLNCTVNSTTLTDDNNQQQQAISILVNPPCAQCIQGANVFLTIQTYNPSYISQLTQNITIQTISVQGTIQSLQTTISLKLLTLAINQYQQQGSGFVGSQYSIYTDFVLPIFTINNGGLLEFSFDQNITYPIVMGNLDQISPQLYFKNVTLLNSNARYFQNSRPNSLQLVTAPICQLSSCLSVKNYSVLINKIRKAFNTADKCCLMIRVKTKQGWGIAQSSINISQYRPKQLKGQLMVSLSNSVANQSSSYNLSFTSNKVPLSTNFSVVFPSQNIILATRCYVTTNFSLGYSINCNVEDANTVRITYNGDPTIMTSAIVRYDITVPNITNAPSLISLAYSVYSSISTSNSQQWKALYSLATPYKINCSFTENNNTYGQASNLTISIPQESMFTFTELKYTIPKDLLMISNNNANYNISENSNNYSIAFSNNNPNGFNFTLLTVNPQTTQPSVNKINVQSYYMGYLAGQGTITLPPAQPMFLDSSIKASNLVVGQLTNLTVQTIRIYPDNKQLSIKIQCPSNGFKYTTALLSNTNTQINSSNNFTVVIPINNLTVQILNLTQLDYVPNISQIKPMIITTLDANGYPIAKSIPKLSTILASIPATSQVVANRNTSKNNIQALISINYSTLYGYDGCILSINLPKKQLYMDYNINCSIGSQNCTILGINLSMTNYYQINVTYLKGLQIKIGNVKNLYPSNDPILVTLYDNQSRVVQQASKMIQPNIQLDLLSLNASLSSSTVATNSKLQLNISSNKIIDISQQLEIIFQTQLFTKWPILNPNKCSYTIYNIQYQACTYFNDSSQWLNIVKLGTLGFLNISSGSIIQITLYLTNAWATYPLINKKMTVNIRNMQGDIISQGVKQMSQLFEFHNNFTEIAFTQLSITPSSLMARSSSKLAIKFGLPIPVNVSLEVILLLPKDSFQFNSADTGNENNTLLANITIDNYYYIKTELFCKNCLTANNSFSYQVYVKNQMFPKIDFKSFILYLNYGNYRMTDFTTLSTPKLTPLSLSGLSTFTRSNYNANQTAKVNFEISSPINITTSSYLSINSNYQGSLFMSTSDATIQQINNANKINNLTLKQSNWKSLLVGTFNLSTNTVTFTINGINNIFVSKSIQSYQFTFYNDTHYLFFNPMVKPIQTLIPFSKGIQYWRNDTTVDTETNTFLKGTLNYPLQNLKVLFNNKSYDIMSSINELDLQLGTLTNPTLITQQTIGACEIGNLTNTLYKNVSLLLEPNLIPKYTSVGIALSNQLYIGTPITTVVTIPSGFDQATTFELASPIFYSRINGCQACIDNNCGIAIISCSIVGKVIQMKINPLSKNANGKLKLSFNLMAIQYQASFINSNFSINYYPPSSYYSEPKNISVLGTPLVVYASFNSYKVNAQANINVKVTTLNRTGKIIVSIPAYIASQTSLSVADTLGNSLQYVSSSNSQQHNFTFSQNPLPKTILFSYTNITNPPDNRELMFKAFQVESFNSSLVYGYGLTTASMTQLDQITVLEAYRDNPKIGQFCNLTITMTIPGYGGLMLIYLPKSQITFDTSLTCNVQVDGRIQDCTYINESAVTTEAGSTNSTYMFRNTLNPTISVYPNDLQKVIVQIGSPYIRAQTTPQTSSYILPYTTAGTITVLQTTQQTAVSLTQNNLFYSLEIEHWEQYTQVLFKFAPYAYYINTNKINCMVNSNPINCTKQSQNQIIFNIPLQNSLNKLASGSSITRSKLMNFSMNHLINYVQDGPFIIQTLKPSSLDNSLGSLDVYQQITNNISFSPAKYYMRVIVPFNFVNKKQTIIVILDSLLPAINLTSIKANFSSKDCLLLENDFNYSYSFECEFSNSGPTNFSLVFYQYLFKNKGLANSNFYETIYDSPTSGCSNSNCNLCSKTASGQYCVNCIQQMSSNNGICVQNCPPGTFSYSQSKRCLLCSPVCSTCYQAFNDNCLSCKDITLLVDSGNCTDTCTTGYSDNGWCVVDNCEVQGCRTCSNTGFCYQCLPGYRGQPNCAKYDILPPLLFIFMVVPFVLLSVAITIYSLVRCLSWQSVNSWWIFSFSLIEFVSWVLSIPLMPQKATVFILCAFIILRIILGIVSYEIFYLGKLTEISEKLLEEQQESKTQQKEVKQHQQTVQPIYTCKSRIVRFFSHFLGTDGYHLMQVQIGRPIHNIEQHFTFVILSIVSRIFLIGLMGYLLGSAFSRMPIVSDRLLVPIVAIGNGFAILGLRILNSDIIRRCLQRLRPSN